MTFILKRGGISYNVFFSFFDSVTEHGGSLGLEHHFNKQHSVSAGISQSDYNFSG